MIDQRKVSVSQIIQRILFTIRIRAAYFLSGYSLNHIGYHLIELGRVLGRNHGNAGLSFHSFACISSHFAACTRYLNIF